MKSRVIWSALLAAVLLAPHAQAQRANAALPEIPARRAVIVTGENSYNGHVWRETSVELKNILDAGKAFQEVKIEPDPNFIANDAFLGYDVAVLDFRNARPLASDAAVQANLLKFLDQGKGIVTIHWANGAFPYWPEFVNIVGRAQQATHDPRGPFDVKIVAADNPIARGMKDYQTDDELFWDFKEGDRPITPLAMAHSKMKDKDFPMAFTVMYGKGRVFNTGMGHDVRALKVQGTADLIRAGAAWAAGAK